MTDHAKGQVEYDATSALVLAGEAQSALAGADILVDSDDMLAIAGDDLKAIKALQKRVEEKRTGITGPLNQAVKAINDLFRAPKEYLDQAEKTLKVAIIGYTEAQEKIAADARCAAEAVARVERERLIEQQREQARIARDAHEAAGKLQQKAQAATIAGDLVAAAAALEQANHEASVAATAQAEANAAAQTAEVVTMHVAASVPAKVTGISDRVTYTAVIEDLMTLVKAVVEGDAPLQCLRADEKFLGAQARAFKKKGPLYPGVTSLAERGLAARGF